jgi:hypothetical protein
MNNKPLCFYDVGELGWSLPLSAHVNYLHNISDREIWVYTWPERFTLYRHIGIKFIEIPREIEAKFKLLDQDGTHLYDHRTKQRVKNSLITVIFETYLRERGLDVEVCNDYGEFHGERTFESLVPSSDIQKKIMDQFLNKVILVFPRARIGKFGSRNLTREFYVYLINWLCDEFKNHIVLSIGTMEGAYCIDAPHGNYKNWVTMNNEKKLDYIAGLCRLNYASFAVGSQSSLPKLTLLCKTPSFMIGHERERHVHYDNWMNTPVGFYDVSLDFSDNYYLSNKEECVKDVIAFGRKYAIAH